MSASSARHDAPPDAAPARFDAPDRSLAADLWALAKPEISFLVTLSAAAGFLLGAQGALPAFELCATLAGVFLSAGGAGALNHYLERGHDARMKRTAARALPAGRVSPRFALRYGIGLIAAGVALLCPLVSPLVAALALLTAALYLFVYTPLKRKTSLNTLVGTVPGALPALGGYAAATGGGLSALTGAGGWAIFTVLACWQMPHFLALAWMYRNDYTRGGYAMVSRKDPTGARTAGQAVLFCTLLVGASAFPFATGDAGSLYLAGALPLGGWFLAESLRFWRERTGQRARALLKVSIYYVPLLLILIAADWLFSVA
ncbi:MAG: protoheme IX farnesyltransferase [Bacteroidetes bacterium QS_9_68_14]|nr:MAG: protoheme IX farnesyltransferase [Bacteroidetes bacterium QS_9_68_14]